MPPKPIIPSTHDMPAEKERSSEGLTQPERTERTESDKSDKSDKRNEHNEGNQSMVYQLKVTLMNGEPPMPPIWRRLLVEGNTTLARLHRILQVVMGWENYHLHQFIVEGVRYGVPDPDFGVQPGEKNERGVRLTTVALTLASQASGRGASFIYEYDFGDGWQHQIRVEKVVAAQDEQDDVYYPLCVEGAGACPPEDVGGIGGYVEFLEAIGNTRHPQHREMLRWVGGSFDPQGFDANAINKALRRLR